MDTIQLPLDFRELLRLLNLNKVEYLVIGGYAVGYHGYPRPTGDLDIGFPTLLTVLNALVKHWRAAGIGPVLERTSSQRGAARIPPVDRTIILSGSCSPVTQRQIAFALKHGFHDIALHPARLLGSRDRAYVFHRYLETILPEDSLRTPIPSAQV